MVHNRRYLADLAPGETDALASLLSLPSRLVDPASGQPSELWLASQARETERLPAPLQKPRDWLARVSMYTNRHLHVAIDDLVPRCAVLCDAHSGLNPWVVHKAFLLVSNEVTCRMDSIRKYIKYPGKYGGKKLTTTTTTTTTDTTTTEEKVKEEMVMVKKLGRYLDSVNTLLALWNPREVFWRIVGGQRRFPKDIMVLPYITSGCEACILAWVGADAAALCGLHASLSGRTRSGEKKKRSRSGNGNGSGRRDINSRKRRRVPVLMPLVEAWIARIDEKERVVEGSRELTRIIKRARRAVGKRKKYRDGKHGRSYSRKRNGGGGGGGDANKSSTTSGMEVPLFDKREREESRRHTRGQRYHGEQFSSSTVTKPLHSYDTHRVMVLDDNPEYHQQQCYASSSHRSNNTYIISHPSASSTAMDDNTHTDYHQEDIGEDLFNAMDENDSCESSESDDSDGLDSIVRLHRASRRWYETYAEGGGTEADDVSTISQLQIQPASHDIEVLAAAALSSSSRRSHNTTAPTTTPTATTLPALPSPSNVNRKFAKSTYEEDESGDFEYNGYFDPSEWTDISVHTHAMGLTATSPPGRKYRMDPTPPVPEVPSIYHHRGHHSGLDVPLVAGNDGLRTEEGTAAAARSLLSPPPSSLYSNNGMAVPHPLTIRSTIRPPMTPVETSSSRPASKNNGDDDDDYYHHYRAPGSIRSSSQRRQRQGQGQEEISFSSYYSSPLITAKWSDPYGDIEIATTTPLPSSAAAGTPAPLSTAEFQAGLDSLDRRQHITRNKSSSPSYASSPSSRQDTVLPDESVSVVHRLYPSAPVNDSANRRHKARREGVGR